MDSVIVGAIIGASIGLMYSGYVLLRARSAKGDAYLSKMTKRVIELDAPQRPEAIIATLKSGVGTHPATIEAVDEAAQRIVFTDRATMTTQGFFYPVWTTPAADGGSRLQIGIASRGNQWGPLVTRAHEKFAAAVARALGLPEEPV